MKLYKCLIGFLKAVFVCIGIMDKLFQNCILKIKIFISLLFPFGAMNALLKINLW